MPKWSVVSRTGACLPRHYVSSLFLSQKLAEEFVFLANDDKFERGTRDAECTSKQIGITQTFEGCFVGNVAEVIVIVIVIVCIVNAHVFITVASVNLAW